MIKFIIFFILFLFLIQSSVLAETDSVLCKFEWESISKKTTCTTYRVILDGTMIDCNNVELKQACSEKLNSSNIPDNAWMRVEHPYERIYWDCSIVKMVCNDENNSNSNNFALNGCYNSMFGQDASDFSLSDIKSGTLIISQLKVNNLDDYKNAGCLESNNSDQSNCDNLFNYFYDKLSTKFPLDIFVPIYNFNAGETACPIIRLFGEELEFCAIVMVAKSVKYIFLITFIIRSVLSI